jgi:tetratricopeptide (TPR) repeat protein
MKRTFVLASAIAITFGLTTMPLWGRGPGGRGGGGYGGGRGGGYGGGGGRGGYGGFHGGQEGRGGSDGFHGGEEGGGRGGSGGSGRPAGNYAQSGARPGAAANGSRYGNAAGSNLNGNHMQNWQQQQHQPYNNWYQGHGNWGNGALANTAGSYAHPWAGSGVGAAAGLTGAAALGTAGMAGWGLGAAYYNSGYQPYYNPYSDGDGSSGSGGYDYSQPVQVVQYADPSQSPQDGGNAAPSNAPTASDQALQESERARRAFRNQDYTGALNNANQALKQMPGDPGLHEVRALTLFALGRYQPSAAAVHSILAVGPGWNWTTMIGLYGDDQQKYTEQLRALETYSQNNPDSSAAHFLLAYHYLTANHSDAAEKELKRVVELTPKDQVAAQLLAVITKPQSEGSTTTPAAAPGAGEKPMTAAALVGDWTSRRDDGSTIQVKFTPDSKFTWIYTAGGKTQQFSGTSADANGLLALQRDDGNAMMAHVTAADGGGFRFRVQGGPPKDPGVIFTH